MIFINESKLKSIQALQFYGGAFFVMGLLALVMPADGPLKYLILGIAVLSGASIFTVISVIESRLP